MSPPPAPALSGYALWLRPGEPERTRLAELIRQLAAQEGTPPFPPHVTLLGALSGREDDLRAHTGAVAAGLAAFPLTFTGASAGGGYFRAVALEVAPSAALLAARRLAAEVFAYRVGDAYRPHLSLLYGDVSPGRAAAIAAGLARAWVGQSVWAAELQLVALEGGPEAWRGAVAAPLPPAP